MSLSAINEKITTELMYENDLASIPLGMTADVAAALLSKSVRMLDDHPKFIYDNIPNELKGWEVVYYSRETTERIDFEMLPVYPEYDARFLSRFYTPEVLDDILTDIQYEILQTIYQLTPNASFINPVGLMLPHVNYLLIQVSEEDLKEVEGDPDENYIGYVSDGCGVELYSETFPD